MTDIQKNLQTKKSFLDLYNKKALNSEQSEFIEDDKEEYLDETGSLTPSIVREDLTAVKGIGVSVAERLNRFGINSVDIIAQSTLENLTQIKGIGLSMAQKLINAAKSHLRVKRLNDFSTNDGDTTDSLKEDQSEDMEQGEMLLSDSLNESLNSDNEQEEETEEFLYDNDIQFEGIEDVTDNIASNFDMVNNETEMGDNLSTDRINSEKLEKFNNFRLKQNSSKELIKKNNDNYSQQEVDNILNNISHELESNGFYLVEIIPELREVCIGLDLLAVKIIRVNEFLELFYILPIKLSPLKGSFMVSAKEIEYSPLKQEIKNFSPLLNLPHSYIKLLKKSYERISSDLLKNGNLSAFFRKYLKVDFTLEQTLTNKNLFFHSGFIQYKILIEPTLISHNKVGFLEKIIPFAYQKNNNIHVIEIKKLSNFLQFLEKKYVLLETFNNKKNSVISHYESVTSVMRSVKYSSIPFVLYGFLLGLLLLFGEFSILQMLINLGYGMVVLYSIIIGYFSIRFLSKKLELSREFETPYYRKDLDLDDTSLILISEELTTDLMSQFTYECLDNNTSSGIITNIERKNAEEFLIKKTLAKQAKNGNNFEREDFKRSELKRDIVEKYSSFLED